MTPNTMSILKGLSRMVTRSAMTTRGSRSLSGSLDAFPTLAECRSQPRAYAQYGNEALLLLAARGDHGACTERLVREVMAVEDRSHQEASEVVDGMAASLRERLVGSGGGSCAGGSTARKLVGASAAIAAVGSVPLVRPATLAHALPRFWALLVQRRSHQPRGKASPVH